MLDRKIPRNNVVVAVAAGQNEIGTGAVKMRSEQELRIRYDDVIGLAGIPVDYGSRAAAIPSDPKIRSRHSTPPLRARPRTPTLPQSDRYPSPYPQRRSEPAERMRHRAAAGNIEVNKR